MESEFFRLTGMIHAIHEIVTILILSSDCVDTLHSLGLRVTSCAMLLVVLSSLHGLRRFVAGNPLWVNALRRTLSLNRGHQLNGNTFFEQPYSSSFGAFP